MTNERPKEEYYREAAQYVNTGERIAAEAGEGVGGTLAFLTRGAHAACRILISPILQVSNNLPHGQWMMPFAPSKGFSSKNLPISLHCWERYVVIWYCGAIDHW
jgi:hypothetical protein